MIRGISHIGIAVHDIEASKALYAKIFAVDSFHEEIVTEQKVHVASFSVGSVAIELTAPTTVDSPISKFLDKRGEGVHHIAFSTDDVNEQLQRLSNEGISLINKQAAIGAHDMLIAFLHPKSTGGVLMELCQPKDKVQ